MGAVKALATSDPGQIDLMTLLSPLRKPVSVVGASVFSAVSSSVSSFARTRSATRELRFNALGRASAARLAREEDERVTATIAVGWAARFWKWPWRDTVHVGKPRQMIRPRRYFFSGRWPKSRCLLAGGTRNMTGKISCFGFTGLKNNNGPRLKNHKTLRLRWQGECCRQNSWRTNRCRRRFKMRSHRATSRWLPSSSTHRSHPTAVHTPAGTRPSWTERVTSWDAPRCTSPPRRGTSGWWNFSSASARRR